MQVDQLPAHRQETASYCHSCGEVRSEAELSICRRCGYRLCGMDGCVSRCACDDAFTILMAEIDSTLETIDVRIQRGESMPLAVSAPGHLGAIMRDIDSVLASLNSVPA